MTVSRRGIVLSGLGAVVTGCAGGSRSSTPRPLAEHSTTGTPPTTPASTSAALPDVAPWTPGAGELVPACKLAAVRRIEAAGNGPETALQVIDAQYGGLLADTASVLVVTRSWHVDGGHAVAGGHSFDVRLSRAGSAWRVTAVHPSHSGAPAPVVTANARGVLSSDRITLPPAAVVDIRSGQVHDSVLAALLAVARTHRPRVSVIRSGHPLFVFGTTRRSDHPQGRAFDTWAIDGHAVVDPRTPRSLVEDYMHSVADAGSYNVGGPYLLGSAPQWFSDDTHHDHVHAGFLG